MCKILDSMVLASLSMGVGQKTRQDRRRTDDLRRSTGKETIRVVEDLYVKGTFDPVTAPMGMFKADIRAVSLASLDDGDRLIPVGKVQWVRERLATCQSERAKGVALLADPAKWREVVAAAKAMRGHDVETEDYPDIPPIERWFYLDFRWKSHPKESALAVALAESHQQLADEIKSEMAGTYQGYIDAAKDDAFKRIREAIGGFVNRCQELRTETRICPNCKYQWAASLGDVCRKCQTVQPVILPKGKKVYESMFEHVRELAATLNCVIPPEDVRPGEIDAIVGPITSMSAADLKDAIADSPVTAAQVLSDCEERGRTVATDLAALVNSTFV